MLSLHMLDYLMPYLSLSTWTWNTFPTLRDTWFFYLSYVLPPRPSKIYGVSAQGPLVFGFGLRVLGQGLTIFIAVMTSLESQLNRYNDLSQDSGLGACICIYPGPPKVRVWVVVMGVFLCLLHRMGHPSVEILCLFGFGFGIFGTRTLPCQFV